MRVNVVIPARVREVRFNVVNAVRWALGRAVGLFLSRFTVGGHSCDANINVRNVGETGAIA